YLSFPLFTRITETPDAPEPEPGPSCVSLKSDQSKGFIFHFKGTKSAAAEELGGCNLTERSCEALSSILSSQSSRLRELDMRNNNLQDSVKLLCVGLGSPHCMLETLRLSGCQITGIGFTSLATALRSNPSYLKELDLSYNHPGDSGMKLLSDQQQDPHDVLLSPPEPKTRAGFLKYSHEITLDPNTANTHLLLSEGNRKVTVMKQQQSYPDHPDRFTEYSQVLSRESLTGRCYWEVEWRGGEVGVAVAYKNISRAGSSYECGFGNNDKSWELHCETSSFQFWHNGFLTVLSGPQSSRVGVYLDHRAGILSFYSVSETMTLLHRVQTTFTHGEVHVAVAYEGIRRKGEADESRFGRNYQSWSLNCSDDKGYYVSHKFDLRAIPLLSSALSHKVAVYVDCSAGTVSFYSVSSDKLIHLHTFNTTFTEPVYAGFRVKPDSSIHLCADSE
uniref:B30.2/SPRY domain-containing protein n=1 Tax=Neolamprologus brichardi TaxID=32507 RepID=A0A3Q4N8N2_NEOBR